MDGGRTAQPEKSRLVVGFSQCAARRGGLFVAFYFVGASSAGGIKSRKHNKQGASSPAVFIGLRSRPSIAYFHIEQQLCGCRQFVLVELIFII